MDSESLHWFGANIHEIHSSPSPSPSILPLTPVSMDRETGNKSSSSNSANSITSEHINSSIASICDDKGDSVTIKNEWDGEDCTSTLSANVCDNLNRFA